MGGVGGGGEGGPLEELTQLRAGSPPAVARAGSPPRPQPTSAGCVFPPAVAAVKCDIDKEFIDVVTKLRAALPRPLLLSSAVWSIGAYGQVGRCQAGRAEPDDTEVLLHSAPGYIAAGSELLWTAPGGLGLQRNASLCSASTRLALRLLDQSFMTIALQGAWVNSQPQGDHTGQSVNMLKAVGDKVGAVGASNRAGLTTMPVFCWHAAVRRGMV